MGLQYSLLVAIHPWPAQEAGARQLVVAVAVGEVVAVVGLLAIVAGILDFERRSCLPALEQYFKVSGRLGDGTCLRFACTFSSYVPQAQAKSWWVEMRGLLAAACFLANAYCECL